MAKIYLSASYSRREEIQGVAACLAALDHKIVSTWHSQQTEEIDKVIAGSWKLAFRDMQDMKAADTFIMFTGDSTSRGGRHTEFGIWLASFRKDKVSHLLGGISPSTIIVGTLENPFQASPHVQHFNSWSGLMIAISKEYYANV